MFALKYKRKIRKREQRNTDRKIKRKRREKRDGYKYTNKH
jgi:hypothetical protein